MRGTNDCAHLLTKCVSGPMSHAPYVISHASLTPMPCSAASPRQSSLQHCNPPTYTALFVIPSLTAVLSSYPPTPPAVIASVSAIPSITALYGEDSVNF